ncbi:MAG: transcriptional regulator MraZ [Myxococcales bacterium]|nr:MAG: transcriptional regulator MraZ [Myxococcales bacterium]
MFTGTYTPKLDDKGRLFLPAKFRDDLKEGLVITRGQDRALEIRTAPDFEAYASRLRDGTDPRMRAYSRMLFALASEQTPDKQGRVSVTPELRTYAGLEKDCVVIGVSNKIEIWEPQAWAEYTAAQEEAFANLTEELFLD